MTETKQVAASFPLVRDSGVLERYYTMRYDIGLDSCVVIAAEYSAGTAGLDRSTVLRALKQVISELPALCVQMTGTPDTTLKFVRIPTINLEQIVEFVDDSSMTLEDLLTADLVRPIPAGAETPLWRVTIYGRNTLFFAFHHAIADGLSGLAFHRLFLSALNATAGNSSSVQHIISTPTRIELEAPIEDVIDVTVSWGRFARTIYDALMPRTWHPAYAAWIGNPKSNEPNSHITVRLRTLSAKDAKNLLDICRQHNCTITTFLHELSTAVISHQVQELAKQGKYEQEYKTVSSSVALSLRRFTGCGPAAACTHISAQQTYAPMLDPNHPYPPTRSTFRWKVAADFGTTLKDGLSSSREVVGLVRWMQNKDSSKETFVKTLGSKRDSLKLSNLGVLSLPPQTSVNGRAPWKIGEVYFSHCDIVPGSAMKLNVVGSPSGSVNITYTWGEGAIEDNLGDAFVEEMDKAIRAILSS